MPVRVPFLRTLQVYLAEQQLVKETTKANWSFSKNRLNMILLENIDWQTHYVPINLKGKTVLDVGAGEGETAKFFLEHGAQKVVCVEPDQECFKRLVYNAERHKELVPINAPFDLGMLKLSFDFMKMDIEGYEQILLGVQLPKPSVLEIHGLYLRDAFKAKGYRMARHVGTDWTCYGYWGC